MNARNAYIARLAMVALDSLVSAKELPLLPRERRVSRRPNHSRDYAGVVCLYGRDWQDNMAVS